MVNGRHKSLLRMRAALPKHGIARSVTCGRLARGMQGLEKRYKRHGFRWTQVFSIGWHVAASLNHLADELVFREPHGNAVERRTPLPAELPERMAIAALFGLKDESALTLKRGGAMQKSFRYRIGAPGVHVRAPRRIPGKMRE